MDTEKGERNMENPIAAETRITNQTSLKHSHTRKAILLMIMVALPFFGMLVVQEFLLNNRVIQNIIGVLTIVTLIVFLATKTKGWRIALLVMTMLLLVVGCCHIRWAWGLSNLALWILILDTAIGLLVARRDLFIRAVIVGFVMAVYYVLYICRFCRYPICAAVNAMTIAFYSGLLIALFSRKTDRRWAVTVIPVVTMAAIIVLPLLAA